MERCDQESQVNGNHEWMIFGDYQTHFVAGARFVGKKERLAI